jgi:AraC family transcriptional regulator
MQEAMAELVPRFENRNAFFIVGLSERYNHKEISGIPAQWQRFAPRLGRIPGQVGWNSYGVCCNFDGAGNMDYICGVEVSANSPVPEGLVQLPVEAQKYAVFTHRDHISQIGKTWDGIYNRWPKTSGQALVMAPQFESYGSDFNPQTGTGVVEIWIPIER